MLKVSKRFKKFLALALTAVFTCSFFTSQPIHANTQLSLLESKDEKIEDKITKFFEHFIDSRLKVFMDKESDLNSFKNLYNKQAADKSKLSEKAKSLHEKGNKFEKKIEGFGQRIRDSKKVIGRDYYNNETTIKIKSINEIESDLYEVVLIESTKLFFKTGKNSPSTYEAYEDEHVFTVLKNKNDFVIINEEMPNSLINIEVTNNNSDTVKMPIGEKLISSSGPATTYAAAAANYDRNFAVQYADKHWSNYNTEQYRTFGNDCTNYISQAIKTGFYGTQDESGSKKWFYTTGYIAGVGYSASWGAAQDSYDYWYFGQINTSKYDQIFYSPPTDFTVLPSDNSIWNYALPGNPIYYHTDPDATVYYNHAGIIVGKLGTLNDFGQLVTYRPVVNCHTNNRYHVDYTLFPYVPYQSLIDRGYYPAISIVNIPNWSPID